MAGVLKGIQDDFGTDAKHPLSDAKSGLLQTAFITALAIGSPLFGYLGDRYNRKLLILIGLLIWTTSVLGSSFIPSSVKSNQIESSNSSSDWNYYVFLASRAFFGFGQAAYVTISPSLIADSFTAEKRSLMLMLYYFAIPVGSGLGFIVGSQIEKAARDWRWGIRATTFLDAILLVLIFIFVQDKKHSTENSTAELKGYRPSYLSDLIGLAKNATFMTSTFAYTAVVFVTGTLSWWIPTAMQHVEAMKLNLTETSKLDNDQKSNATFIFGLITIISGFTGVATGSVLSHLLSSGRFCFSYCSTPRSDPIICAIGTLIGVPTLLAALQLLPRNIIVSEIFMFCCITGLCFIWATNVNLYISVVTPDKRNTANGIQILFSHILGDGSGPYIIGFISDSIRDPKDISPGGHWRSLETAFYVANALLIPAVILFIVAAIMYPRDRAAFLRSTNCSMVEIGDLATAIDNGASTIKIAPLDNAPPPVKMMVPSDPPAPEETSPNSANVVEKTAQDGL